MKTYVNWTLIRDYSPSPNSVENKEWEYIITPQQFHEPEIANQDVTNAEVVIPSRGSKCHIVS